jgi:hypothetical protein
MEAPAEVIDGEISQALAVVERPAGLALWDAQALRATMQRESELRQVMLEYVKSHMKRGYHYYSRSDFREEGEDRPPGDDDKPSLKKEGALNLCHLLHCRPKAPEVFETFHGDGHYTVRTRVPIVSLRTGDVMGEGEGLCSTLESKYAWRWVPEWLMGDTPRGGLVRR